MPKEIGVKMFVKGQAIPIKSPVLHKWDIDGNLVLTFNIGQNGQDDVKMIFDKREYFNITDDEIKNDVNEKGN
jgi:hypothetical protein